MSAIMSGNPVEIAEPTEARQDSLAERLARAPLSLEEALRYATEVALVLRDLHRQGLAYGAVSSQSIELGESGAGLRPTPGLKRLGDGRRDVAAFGAVLDELLCRTGTAGGAFEGLREEARALARRCSNESPPMRQVFIALRLLVLQARQYRTGRLLRPPEAHATRPSAPRPARAAVRAGRLWESLARLAAACVRSAL
jgi:hypothetical protein